MELQSLDYDAIQVLQQEKRDMKTIDLPQGLDSMEGCRSYSVANDGTEFKNRKERVRQIGGFALEAFWVDTRMRRRCLSMFLIMTDFVMR